ncbi:hypothetical protein [Pseudoxanthomonas sp. SE1]|uniref:AbiTii domain-containing protein n=1 Tax=Pseudoxanthomonas sp. SE1 TaxID=1664560 RepID=UPI00240D8065|nr:hypothetical protein [Pseudoxanthomonas sp. SE1]WFC43213.1 hypothetical protein OY559_06805 [Pseudoxanthomonas sp. SE1]
MGLITDIISAGLDSSTTELLNKALIAATRLGDASMVEFASKELNGYQGSDLPDHRKLRGQLKARTPYSGWEVAPISTDDLGFLLVTKFSEGVAEMEDLISTSGAGMVQVIPGPGQQQLLRKMFSAESDVTFAQFVTKSAVVQSLQRSRSIVLDWALKLEASGVAGDGLTFSSKERRAAPHITNTLINHGVMLQPHIQQGGDGDQAMDLGPDFQTLSALMVEVLGRVNELGPAAAEAQADAQTVLAQINSGKPKEGVVRACLESLRSIMENATGTLLADEVKNKLAPYLVSLGPMIAALAG